MSILTVQKSANSKNDSSQPTKSSNSGSVETTNRNSEKIRLAAIASILIAYALSLAFGAPVDANVAFATTIGSITAITGFSIRKIV